MALTQLFLILILVKAILNLFPHFNGKNIYAHLFNEKNISSLKEAKSPSCYVAM